MSEVTTRVQWRFRLLTCCLVLTTLALIQSPGRTVADTKLDLVINPGGFLHRALDLWDPQGSFGQVQNQAYGYFFPMGPFFWLGHLIGLDPWVIQRLWWALLLSVAFLGMVKLAGALGVSSPTARLLAGFAFALSPRMLSVIGPSSIEVWPMALAPWVLLPLVIGTRRGNPIRMAALSAVGVMLVGGVNAAATFAVIPLGVLWLLSAEPGPRRRRLMIWWPAFVLIGTLWWLIPLFLLGSYSPPFLDFIESAANTTVAANLFDGLRGTSDWVAYVSSDAAAGKDLISQPLLILNGVVVMALGLVGLARRHTPHRQFLFSGVVVGLFLVTAGHVGTMSGWGSTDLQHALDGALAPLRNTHKFDVVLRIPLVLGLAFLVSALGERARDRSRNDEAIKALGVTLLAIVAVVGATSPAWAGNLANKGSFDSIPTYWRQASTWLDDNSDGRSMLVPASAFPEYLWGSTGDEPLQPLAHGDWAVRNSIPLTNPGTIRLLDAVTVELAQGKASEGLASTLRRSGVQFLVLRNDLDDARLAANEEAVYETLKTSAGITLVKSFGPQVGSDPEGFGGDLRSFVDGGWQSRHQAIQIFSVGPAPDSRSQDAAETPTVVGSAASLADLGDLGVTDDRSVFLAQDQPRGLTPESVVLTDESRRQEAAFGSVYDNRSASLTPAEAYAATRPVHDYVTAADVPWLAVPSLRGADSLTASSSRSAATTLGGARPASLPFAAFDGDATSSWLADKASGWIRLGLGAKRDLGQVTFRADLAPGTTESLSVTTAAGARRLVLTGREAKSIGIGSVSSLTVHGSTRAGDFFSLAEISGPALSVSRPLVLPELQAGWPTPVTIALGLDSSRRPGCLTVLSLVRCRADIASAGEDGAAIDRIFSLPSATSYGTSIAVQPIGGQSLDDYLQRGLPGRVRASSTVNDDPQALASRVIDHDLKTGWIARPGDTDPTISMRWDSVHRLHELHLATASSLPASIPTTAVLDFGNGQQRTVTFRNGSATFDEVTSDRVDIHLQAGKPALDYDSIGLNSPLPVGVSEVWFRDARLSFDSTTSPMTLPCGSGPDLDVNGVQTQTSVETTTADLAAAVPAKATPCGESKVDLSGGSNRLTVRSSALFRPTSMVLTHGTPVHGASTAVQRTDHSSVSRVMALPDGPRRVISTTENFNPGWKAAAGGHGLEAVQVNGWQQAWIAPAGTSGAVDLTFAPNRTYHAGLIVGAVAALLLLILAAWRRYSDTPRETGAGRRMGRRGLGAFAAAGLVSAVVLGGVPGLVAGVAGAGLAILASRRFGEPEWLVTVPLAIAGVLYAIRPWGGAGTWAGTTELPQICVAVTLGIVAGLVGSDRQALSRKNGSSITR